MATTTEKTRKTGVQPQNFTQHGTDSALSEAVDSLVQLKQPRGAQQDDRYETAGTPPDRRWGGALRVWSADIYMKGNNKLTFEFGEDEPDEQEPLSILVELIDNAKKHRGSIHFGDVQDYTRFVHLNGELLCRGDQMNLTVWADDVLMLSV